MLCSHGEHEVWNETCHCRNKHENDLRTGMVDVDVIKCVQNMEGCHLSVIIMTRLLVMKIVSYRDHKPEWESKYGMSSRSTLGEWNMMIPNVYMKCLNHHVMRCVCYMAMAMWSAWHVHHCHLLVAQDWFTKLVIHICSFSQVSSSNESSTCTRNTKQTELVEVEVLVVFSVWAEEEYWSIHRARARIATRYL